MPSAIEVPGSIHLEEIRAKLTADGFAISAGAAVFAKDGDAVCLTQSKYSEQIEGKGEQGYKFPKGGIRTGESALDAALRELEEETGINPSAATECVALHGKYNIEDERRAKDGRRKFIVMAGLVLPQTVELNPQDPSSVTALWVPRHEARKIFTRQAEVHEQPKRSANNHEILNRLEAAFGLPPSR